MKSQSHINTFIHVFWLRFTENRLPQAAGYLTYSTLLALVPLLLVGFAIFAAFPMFNDLSIEVKQFLFTNFTPTISDTVGEYLDQFVANTKQMSIVGIAGLIVVALMLIRTIDKTLNHMYPNTRGRTVVFSFAIYWMILTLGPLLIAISFGISGYLTSLDVFHHEDKTLGFSLLKFIPFLLTWCLFTLIYTIVPTTKVDLKYAATGAFLAALFFTLGRSAFSWYIVHFPSYQLIYGAMATLPILLLWIQLSWTVVLLGALLTAVLKDIHLIKVGELDIKLHPIVPQSNPIHLIPEQPESEENNVSSTEKSPS